MSPSDVFDITTFLGKLSVLGFAILFAVLTWTSFIRGWISTGAERTRAELQYEKRLDEAEERRKEAEARAERNLKGWEEATDQFERALDLVEKMQNRRRRSDESA